MMSLVVISVYSPNSLGDLVDDVDGTPVSREKYYEWQLWDGQQWLTIEQDHVIETHYCQPGAKGITIHTAQGPVSIDFDTLQTAPDGAVKVQRVTALPQGQAEAVGWYFRDDQLWREYGSPSSSMLQSSIGSAEVERQFTGDPRGAFTFTVGPMSYTLNFSTMIQTNCSTGLQRSVRRRPKFTSNTGSLHYKWEFMGEEGEWTQYQAHVCALDSAAIERQYQLDTQGQLHFNTKRFSYTLDFSRMCQVNDNTGTRRAVRRTADCRIQQTSLGTAPQWQFQDIDGMWKDYSKGKHQCSVSSQDIELQYKASPSGVMMFTTNSFKYELNFSAMTQRNLSTNTSRSVRRLTPQQ